MDKNKKNRYTGIFLLAVVFNLNQPLKACFRLCCRFFYYNSIDFVCLNVNRKLFYCLETPKSKLVLSNYRGKECHERLVKRKDLTTPCRFTNSKHIKYIKYLYPAAMPS